MVGAYHAIDERGDALIIVNSARRRTALAFSATCMALASFGCRPVHNGHWAERFRPAWEIANAVTCFYIITVNQQRSQQILFLS